MNQILAASAALILALILFGLNKRPLKSILRRQQPEFLASRQPKQTSLLKKYKSSETWQQDAFSSSQRETWQKPTTAKERINLQNQLRKSFLFGPEARLEAVRIAGLWGHPSVISILRRGLKDSDMRVVRAAAAALQMRRKVPTSIGIGPQSKVSPPRNVARMR